MVDPKAWLMQNIDLVLLVMVVLLVIVLIMFIANTVKLNQLHKRYRTLMRGVKNENLEELLFRYGEDVRKMEAAVQEIRSTHQQQLEQIEQSLGPVGIVRYNGFPEAGSDLSFSIAWLNRAADGVVYTSIFGREESRSYAKPIVAGASTYTLTDEEKEAIQIAIEKMNKR